LNYLQKMVKNSTQELSVWKKMLTVGSKWEDKDQILDVIYWGRQLLAIIMGLVWGYLGFTGIFGLTSFVITNSIAVYFYSINFNTDNDDVMQDVKEGFMTSFASFLVSWILIYSALYF